MNNWTPCAKAQPAESGKYLATLKGGARVSDYTSAEEYLAKKWIKEIEVDGQTKILDITDQVIAWQPLPTPYSFD